MIKQTLATLLVVAMASAVSTAAAAAQSAITPQMNTGHTANRSPETPAVSPTADQIGASDVIGAAVENGNGAIVAKISDITIDRQTGAALVIVAPAGKKPFGTANSAVVWNSLRFDPRPTPHFVTRLDGRALAAGRALAEKATAEGAYYDIKTDLLGKEVVGADNAPLGHVHDLVMTLATGRPVALVIETGGVISIGARNHAVSWNAANPQIGTKGGPVHVALSKAQIEHAPVTATMAPAPIPPKTGSNQLRIRRDPFGHVSGEFVPAPANTR
ncbi:MAG: PRC-barrel domain-containing protein [Stellaceae bacterium]